MCIIETRTHHFPANHKGLTEYHTTLQVQDGSLSFESQLDAILKAYSAETAGKEVLLRRFFLSDPANQEARLDKRLADLPAAATSIIGQPPLNGTKIAAWIYAVEGGAGEGGVFSHNGSQHLWTGSMISARPVEMISGA